MAKPINNNQPHISTGMSIALGEFNDTSSIDKFGLNSSVGGSYETIWDGGATYAYPGSAVAMTVTSAGGSTDEDVEVTVVGLDTNYDQVTQTVTLDASGTATTTALLRVFRAFTASEQLATGTVTISASAVTYAQYSVDFQQTLMAVYTIPRGKTGYLLSANLSSTKEKDITGKLMMREFGGALRTKGLVLTPGQPFQRTWSIPQQIPARTDIEIRAKAGATGPVAAGFEIVLVDV